jgi:nucleoside-diphosphate-sugar epimerase
VALDNLVAKLIGKGDVANRLFSSKARELLGWQPVTTMDEQLAKMAEVSLSEACKNNHEDTKTRSS